MESADSARAVPDSWPGLLVAVIAGTLGVWWIVSSVANRTSNAPPRFRKLFLLDLIGLTLQFLRDPVKLAWEAQEKLGNCFSVSIVGRKLTFLCGPEAQRAFYNAPIQLFDHSHYNVPLDPQDAVDAKKLEERIAILKEALSPPSLDSMMIEIEQQISTFLDTWGDAGEVELFPALSELIGAVCARSFLGEELTQGGPARLELLPLELTALAPVNTPLALLYPTLPSYSDLSRERAAESFGAAVTAAIVARRAKGRTSQAAQPPSDLLQRLCDARYADGSTLAEHEIAGVLVGVMGGQERVAVGAVWTGVRLLHSHRTLLPKVEAEEVTCRGRRLPGEGEGGGQAIPKRRKRNQALELAIVEALATHPPLSLLRRSVAPKGETLPDGLGGFNVPPDHTLLLCPYLSAPHPPPPASDTPSTSEPHKIFGTGGVTCGGKALTLHVISAIWGYLLHHMHLQLIPPPPMPLPGSLVQFPAPPCRLRYRRRDPSE